MLSILTTPARNQKPGWAVVVMRTAHLGFTTGKLTLMLMQTAEKSQAFCHRQDYIGTLLDNKKRMQKHMARSVN